MTAEEFTRLGSGLYPRTPSLWRRYLAAAMGVSERSVYRWSNDERAVDERTESHLRALVRARECE